MQENTRHEIENISAGTSVKYFQNLEQKRREWADALRTRAITLKIFTITSLSWLAAAPLPPSLERNVFLMAYAPYGARTIPT